MDKELKQEEESESESSEEVKVVKKIIASDKPKSYVVSMGENNRKIVTAVYDESSFSL